ncbi:protein arginine kinase [Clostridiaceae bacterium M8S5]|nr:protein arginine kinase [Clostridiaceae bacterium M8S5]
MSKWLKGSGSDKDVVISSRIRLARNLKDYNFPHRLKGDTSTEIINKIKDIIGGEKGLLNGYGFHVLKSMSDIQKNAYVEEHLISKGLVDNSARSAFAISRDEKKVVMINEEDHIRLQVILPGFNLLEAWKICNEIDDIFERKLDYAYDENLGYLTSCPTNVGTGIRVSAMVHLPCLVLTKQINKILQAVSQIGVTIRGLYGEGTDILGNIFQISNQITLGETEEEIIRMIKNTVLQILSKERISREMILSKGRIAVEDKVFRALGILKNARIVGINDAMKLLSDIRMGCAMGLIKDLDYYTINKLMIWVQPSMIQKNNYSNLNQHEISIKRAELLRRELNT